MRDLDFDALAFDFAIRRLSHFAFGVNFVFLADIGHLIAVERLDMIIRQVQAGTMRIIRLLVLDWLGTLLGLCRLQMYITVAHSPILRLISLNRSACDNSERRGGMYSFPTSTQPCARRWSLCCRRPPITDLSMTDWYSAMSLMTMWA